MVKMTTVRRAVLLAALAAEASLLSACATGQQSLVAGHRSAQSAANEVEDNDSPVTFAQAAPDLIAASGTALLPGGRHLSARTPGLGVAPGGLLGQLTDPEGAKASVLGQPAGGGVSVRAAEPLATATLAVNSPLSGPLLTLGGSPSLLGGSANLGAPGAVLATTAGVDVGGGVSPANAATRLLAAAGGAVTAISLTPPVAPGAGGGVPPVTAPVVSVAAGVPGTVPLPALLGLLKSGLLGH